MEMCVFLFSGVADGSFCTQKERTGTSTVSIHAPDKGILSEKDIKDSILRAGGANNVSGVFLQQNCREATQVTSKTGVNRRSVSIVPQTSIAPDLLKRIKRGT